MNIHDKTRTLFSAISRNDFDLCNELLITYGAELLNSQDIFGTTALHLAVKNGHENLVELLLKQPNIDTNLQAYQHSKTGQTYSPLDFALKYDASPKIVESLLDAGATTQHPEQLLNLLLGADEGEDDKKETNCDKKEELLFTQQELAEETRIFEKILTKIPEVGFKEGWPLSLYLIEAYNQATDERSKIILENLINVVKKLPCNKYTDSFLATKDLTHAFPNSHEYDTNNEYSETLFKSQGYSKNFAFKSFHTSFVDFQKIMPIFNSNPDIANYNNFKQHIFSEVNTTYTMTENYASSYGIKETSTELFNLYEAGQTLLLRSGWDEHAVDVILNKNLNLYIVANSGERYLELPAGVKAYNHQLPITADSIYKILNNSEQHYLEYDQYYDLQLTENADFSESFPDQTYGNCSLNSLLVANWSLIHLNLHNAHMPATLAKATAHIWHNDLVEHHKTLVLKNYISDPYLKSDKVLYDTLVTNQSTFEHPEKEVQAKLILDYLTTDEHLAAFSKYYQEHQADFSSDLNQFMQKNGYKDKVLIASDVLKMENSSDVLFDNIEQYNEKHASITETDTPIFNPHANMIDLFNLAVHSTEAFL